MGFRFRKSVKLAPGVRMNFSKSGVGFSAGIPGTGISYNTKSRRKKSSSSSGTVLYWLFIGWWWWIIRGFYYDIPKAIIKRTKKAIQENKKPEA